MNSLKSEKSPYLKQHAKNPVQWYPWGGEAFEKAKQENKPIFLSIGYSTCHWCHVMEKESFEDAEVAKVLNKSFVSIKVDREERPDIDTVYMDVCLRLTGSGGWPLTIIMTAEQKPFFAGTYLPKKTMYGRIGLIDLLEKISKLWQENRDNIIYESERIADAVTKETKIAEGKDPSIYMLHAAFSQFKGLYDEENGGFGNAPKFPTPHNLLFLLKYAYHENNKTAKSMVEKTLIQMFRGGIFDHIGGGFSRYSTDKKYLVPHFEKMLYDNALLLYTYAYYLQFDDKNTQFFTRIISMTADYMVRELKHKFGGFFSAQDADSDGKEGSYYLFSPEDINSLLDKETAEAIRREFDINIEGHLEGLCVPNLLNNCDYTNAFSTMDKARAKLKEFRENKPLLTDHKVLTSWNALAIAALAKAYVLTDNKTYLQNAEDAYRFVEENLMDKEGNIFLRWCEGETKYDGQLDDYAFLAWALIELYEATYDIAYLKVAKELAEKMYILFDGECGGLYMYSAFSEQLLKRPKEYYDGAIPSGNSVAAFVFEKLARISGESKWIQRSNNIFKILTEVSEHYLAGHTFSMFALSNLLYPKYDLVCVTPQNNVPEELKEIQKTAAIKNVNIIVKTPENKEILQTVADFTKDYNITDKTMYYLCKNGTCGSPIDNITDIIEALKM